MLPELENSKKKQIELSKQTHKLHIVVLNSITFFQALLKKKVRVRAVSYQLRYLPQQDQNILTKMVSVNTKHSHVRTIAGIAP